MAFNGPFGGWLRQRRKALDLTQTDLADQVGCSVMTVRKIEAGVRRPSRQIVERMADVLAVSAAERTAFLAFARQSTTVPTIVPVASPVRPVAHNLPAQLTSFIGRTDELVQISTKLAESRCRLLTLVGPGGIGKTRLALQAAGRQVGHFEDGVYFVSLASVGSPALIASSIANALETSFFGPEDPDIQIVSFLHMKAILLVLDNFEHLSGGSGLLTKILANCAHVKLLITSRERLNLQEEWILPIDGLPFPKEGEVEQLESFPAIELFMQRAQQVQPAFSLSDDINSIIAICRTVEGMPLGIELATTWLRAMPCRQIAEQIAASTDFLVSPLRNVAERHRNMRAVFDQSWRLLSEVERSVLMKLSVFRGGFDQNAAEQVCDADLSVLAGLIDKSFVRRGQTGRYDMHELFRQYAADKLHESGEAAERRHFEYFLGLTEQASQHYYSPQTAIWLDRLEVEHDNIRAALAWSLINDVSDHGLHLAATLAWFWRNRFYRHEGRAWLERFLASSSASASSVTRATAIYQLAYLMCMMGDNARAKALATEALSMARSLGDRPTIAWSLLIRGQVIKMSDGGSYAASLLEEALSLFRELGDPRGLDTARLYVGRAMLDLHNYQRAAVVLQEGIVFDRRAGIKWQLANHLGLLACVALYQNSRASQVIALFEEGLLLAREVGDRFMIAESLLGLGHVAHAQGNYEQARRHYQDSIASMDREAGHKYSIAECLWGLGAVARAEGDYEQSRRYFQECLILNEGLDKWDTACCLSGLGGLAGIQNEPQRAAKLLGAAAALFEKHRDLYAADRIIFDRDVGMVRAGLGETTFATAWNEGQAMAVDEVVAYALETTSPASEQSADSAGG